MDPLIPHEPSANVDEDPIQGALDAVSRRLCRPRFLQDLTPSRLPSCAASDASLSPREPPSNRRSFTLESFDLHLKSPLRTGLAAPDILRGIDLSILLLLGFEQHGSIPEIHPSAVEESRSSFRKAIRAFETMTTERVFQGFSHGHQDLVLAVDFNYYGTRMVTASSDHRLKVWDRKDESWSLVDTWRGHDAEVVDVKWNGPFLGEVLGSIAEDGRFKLWQEDVTEVPNSGTRFRLLSSLVSENNVPFMSLDFKNIFQETYLALITRDGFLSVYRPVDQGNLSEWQIMTSMYVCATPSRQDETGFKVCFHHEKLPCWTAVMAGVDRKALSLAVAAMDVVKIYRTDKQRYFYVAAELTGAQNIIRDVAWANSAMRGSDTIATASKDGAIRIYDLSTPKSTNIPESDASANAPPTIAENGNHSKGRSSRSAPSGIGAGLANTTRTGETVQDAVEEQNPGRVKHQVKMVAELKNHHGAVWRITFSQMGDLLASTGDDGKIRTWRRAINGSWLEYSEMDATKSGRDATEQE